LAVVPDPRMERLLAAMRAQRDAESGARAGEQGHPADFGELAELLDRRDRDFSAWAARIEQARLGVRERARRLALASRAKAEFMADVSHELRTPLSSLLILAKLLADDAEGTLTPRQLDYARTIHGAAQDLLRLINDLLDLSQVEAGRIEVRAAPVPLAGLAARLEEAFRGQAAAKGLELTVSVSTDAPETVESDGQRLEQILRNLLSNALRFTDHGSVALEIGPDPADPELLLFAVRDTGVGISQDRLELVFEPFQQADAAAGRRYGAGLGLSISRELARLLGGELEAASVPSQGSTFTLVLPTAAARSDVGPELESGLGRELRGEDAVPDLPGASGAFGAEGSAEPGASPSRLSGEASTGEPAVVLVVEPRGARALRQAAQTALDGLGAVRGRVELALVADENVGEIEQVLAGRDVVGVLIDLRIPREAVQGLLAAVADYAPATVILAYQAGASGGEAARLESSPGGVPQIEVVGSRAQAVERLTLHLLTALPAPAAGLSLASEPRPSALRFRGEKVLVVDDDVRNVFAMTSMLELHGLSVVHADNGRQGIDLLLENPDISLVLMDLMMPGMDGYTATRYIRSLDRFADLPIIAVTAKAMRGDRERSLAAGANEHVIKPVDVDALLAIIRSMIAG